MCAVLPSAGTQKPAENGGRAKIVSRECYGIAAIFCSARCRCLLGREQLAHHFATVRSASKPWIQPFNFVKPRT